MSKTERIQVDCGMNNLASGKDVRRFAQNSCFASSHRARNDQQRIWRLAEGNPVNDGVVFWIRAVAYDLAMKILSDTPAGDVLYGHRIDETSFAESCVSPFNKRGHHFPAKTLSVRAFLEPKTDFGRNRFRIFKRGHAKAFPVVEPADDERKLVWLRSLRSLLASRHVLAPRWRLPWHESGDGRRDASKNLLCIHHLELAELQSRGLDDNHCVRVSLSTTDNTSIDSWRKQAISPPITQSRVVV